MRRPHYDFPFFLTDNFFAGKKKLKLKKPKTTTTKLKEVVK
jgi:hypothetical protein